MGTTLFSFSSISDPDIIQVYFKARSDKKGKGELDRRIPSCLLQYFKLSHYEALSDTTIVNTSTNDTTIVNTGTNDTTIVNTGTNLGDRCEEASNA
jgi:hypothetical protein